MIIALNILAFVFLLFLVKSPNKGITSFQFMLPSIVIVVDNIVEATYNPAYLSTAWFQILFGCNILLWLFIGVSSDYQESASYKIDIFYLVSLGVNMIFQKLLSTKNL